MSVRTLRSHSLCSTLATLVGGAICAMALLAATAKADSDWPQFRGAGGLGSSRDKGLPTTWGPSQNIVWKTELPGAGASSPIILGDRIYLTCFSGFKVPGQEGGTPEDLRLYLIALDRAGKVLWDCYVTPKLPEQANIREDHGYATSTPVADAERVYTFFGKTGVVAFDHQGKKLWQTSVGERLNGWGSAASPVLHKNLVIVNASVESDSLVALDAKTGREVWRTPNIKESWNTPILVNVGGKTELAVAVFQKILGIDPATGNELWSCNTNINWYMAPSMVANGDVIYSVGGRTGGGLAVRAGGRGDVTDTHRVWTIGKGSNVTSPLFHEGHLYWMHEALGIAYCADASSGEIVYEERIPRCTQVYASPILVDGKIYYLSRDGKAYVVAARPKFELLSTNNLEERGIFDSSPATAGSRIYLRSNKYLYCIGSK